MPATTALVRLAPPSFMAGYTFHFKHQAEPRRGGAEGAAHARRLHPREPGRLARRVRGARRPDRPVPDGLGGAVPRRPVRRRGRFDPHLRSRHPAQPLPGARGAPAARPRVPDGRGRAHRLPRALAREASRATRPRCASTRTSAPASPPPASSTTCRCSSTRRRRCSTTSAPRRRWCCTARSTRRCSASGPTRASAIASCSTTAERPILPPEELFLKPEEFFTACGAHALLCAARQERRRASPGRPPCPTSASTAARPSRWSGCSDHVAATPHRVLIVAESEGRRESLLELLRDSRIDPPSVATLAEFEAGDERFAIAVAPLAQGFAARPKATADARERSSSSPRPSCSRSRPARAGAAARSR